MRLGRLQAPNVPEFDGTGKDPDRKRKKRRKKKMTKEEEEWNKLIAVLNKEQQAIAARGIMNPPEFCVALTVVACEAALTYIPDEEEVFKLLLGAMDSALKNFREREGKDEKEIQKPEDSSDNAPTE